LRKNTENKIPCYNKNKAYKSHFLRNARPMFSFAHKHFIQQQSFLLLPLIFYCSGIVTHASFSWLWILLVGVILNIIWYVQKRSIGKIIMVGTLACLAGNIITNYHKNSFEQFFLRTKDAHFQVRGRVHDVQMLDQPIYKYLVTLPITALAHIDTPWQWQPIDKVIHWYCIKKPTCISGDMVELNEVSFKKPTKESFNLYLMKENIAATFFSPLLPIKSITPSGKNTSLNKAKATLVETIAKQCSQKTALLLAPLFFGSKTARNNKSLRIKQQFATWGISHYLARSGLHLVLFVALWEVCLRLIPLPYLLKQGIQLALILIYFLFSYSSISFLRALWMFITYKLCLLLSLRPHILHILLLVATAVLLLNPLQLFFLDFQLSFALTYALAWISKLQIPKKSST
jgi:predicted membrane metal-binding protein